VLVASSTKQEIRVRSSGRDDKERVVAYLKSRDWDVWTSGESGLAQATVVAGWGKPQVAPLRCAPVEMAKGRAVLPGTVVAEQAPFFINLGESAGP
jgi:hypothetical protein